MSKAIAYPNGATHGTLGVGSEPCPQLLDYGVGATKSDKSITYISKKIVTAVKSFILPSPISLGQGLINRLQS